jgi:signal transduction histidine kinase/ligand-binding sensor domain-containing protein
MNRCSRVAALLLAAICASSALAQSWRVRTWTTGDDLPQGVVYAIYQTRDGYIWITTLGGLVRYDGVEMTVFDRATTPGIRSNRFTTLLEDATGTMWIGTDDGFVTRFDGRAFTTYSVDGTLTPVYAISAGAGAAWVYTKNGIFSFDGARFVRSGPATGTQRFLYRTGPVAVVETGLALFEPGRPQQTVPLDGRRIRAVSYDERSLWVIDGEEGILRMENGALRKVEDPATKPILRIVRDAGAPTPAFDPIGALSRSRDGAFWIGVMERGIARVAGDAVEWITPADGLCTGGAIQIYEDREGTMWVGCRGGGVSAIRRRAARTYGAAAGLAPPNAYPLLERGGELVVGSWGGGLYRFDGSAFHRALPSAGWIMSLGDGGDGALWVSEANGGVSLIQGDRIRRFGRDDGLPSMHVRVIYRARNGRMWFGTSQGLATVDENWRFTSFMSAAPATRWIQAIAEERDGSLLLGTRGGLLRFRDGRFATVADEKSGLSSAAVRAIHVGADGTIWVGTYDGGLNRLRNGRISVIGKREGLFDSGVFAIVEESGFFWMSSNRGVHRASIRELDAVADGKLRTIASIALTQSDGLLTAECNGGIQPAAARTPDGRIWFPTQAGIVAIDPTLVDADIPPPSPHITDVSIDGEHVPPGAVVQVGPATRRIEIRFAAPTSVEARVRYRYRLEGYENRWNEIVDTRVATYMGIPPGRYRFVVSASTAAGRWSETPATTELQVLPPFWRTWWFLTAAIAGVVLLLGTAYRLRIRSMERENAAQAEFSRRLLTQQEEERKRIATELHDSLGQNLLVIKNRALLGIDGEHAPQEQLQEISATASSAIEEVRRIAHNLRPVELDHLGLTKSIEVLLRRVSSSSPILFSGQFDDVDQLLPKEAEVNLFRIVQEWLSNVTRHSSATAAVVSLKRQPQGLRLRIQDNGTGFPNARKESREGIGLRSVAERVEMLGARYEILSAPGEGTAMTIDIPLGERR